MVLAPMLQALKLLVLVAPLRCVLFHPVLIQVKVAPLKEINPMESQHHSTESCMNEECIVCDVDVPMDDDHPQEQPQIENEDAVHVSAVHPDAQYEAPPPTESNNTVDDVRPLRTAPAQSLVVYDRPDVPKGDDLTKLVSSWMLNENFEQLACRLLLAKDAVEPFLSAKMRASARCLCNDPLADCPDETAMFLVSAFSVAHTAYEQGRLTPEHHTQMQQSGSMPEELYRYNPMVITVLDAVDAVHGEQGNEVRGAGYRTSRRAATENLVRINARNTLNVARHAFWVFKGHWHAVLPNEAFNARSLPLQQKQSDAFSLVGRMLANHVRGVLMLQEGFHRKVERSLASARAAAVSSSDSTPTEDQPPTAQATGEADVVSLIVHKNVSIMSTLMQSISSHESTEAALPLFVNVVAQINDFDDDNEEERSSSAVGDVGVETRSRKGKRTRSDDNGRGKRHAEVVYGPQDRVTLEQAVDVGRVATYAVLAYVARPLSDLHAGNNPQDTAFGALKISYMNTSRKQCLFVAELLRDIYDNLFDFMVVRLGHRTRLPVTPESHLAASAAGARTVYHPSQREFMEQVYDTMRKDKDTLKA